MEKTLQQYDAVTNECADLFNNKLKDYGTSWRIMRLPSLTDQIYIKANRIRSLQENEVQKVAEGERSEFIGIINYAAIALIQLDLGVTNCADLSIEEAIKLYTIKIKEAKTLMQNKNHDYGEAWRDMRVSSMTDLILQKLLRIKQIEDNQGKTIVSEGLDANYLDILNYAVFSMIHLNELEHTKE
ncbi:DUF1599 domain-containing protein [Flavobacteriaceae bacterium Ap0902]|nr:DUF1599 domain-containing protein [Flavobacteriaceae bacterium Ap0902]